MKKVWILRLLIFSFAMLLSSAQAESLFPRFTFTPARPMPGTAVTFNASSSICTASPCTYRWTDDADGSSLGVGRIMAFSFQQAGTKYVRLTITDARGKTATGESDVVVQIDLPPPPPPAPPPTGITEYYVDSDYSGSVNEGSAARPWTNVGTAEWSAINTALGMRDVILYFSARQAITDVDQVYGAPDEIDLNNKSNNNFRLILDGHTKYNTNDSTPNWQPYSGQAKATVKSFYAQNGTRTKHSKITIDGFRIRRTTAGSALAICGDDWTIRNSDIFHTSGATDGPLVLIVPTANGANEGTDWWCPASSAITIENNVIHDSRGELLYVGGAGCSAEDNTGLSRCGGFPSHRNILIQNNTLYNGGMYGPQGDGIDVKAGLSNLRIIHNTIYALNDRENSGIRAIVIGGARTTDPDQNIVVEGNWIYDVKAEDAAIALVDGWGTPKGVEIRNNVIANLERGQGIKVYRGTNHRIVNNTIYKAAGEAIAVVTGSVTVSNNLLIDNNAGGPQVSFSGTVLSTNNGYSGTFGGSCTACVSGLSAALFLNAAGQNFHLVSGAAVLDRAVALNGFSGDRDGVVRPQGAGWDIGALEWTVGPLPLGNGGPARGGRK